MKKPAACSMPETSLLSSHSTLNCGCHFLSWSYHHLWHACRFAPFIHKQWTTSIWKKGTPRCYKSSIAKDVFPPLATSLNHACSWAGVTKIDLVTKYEFRHSYSATSFHSERQCALCSAKEKSTGNDSKEGRGEGSHLKFIGHYQIFSLHTMQAGEYYSRKSLIRTSVIRTRRLSERHRKPRPPLRSPRGLCTQAEAAVRYG